MRKPVINSINLSRMLYFLIGIMFLMFVSWIASFNYKEMKARDAGRYAYSNLRATAVALESYYVDHNAFPPSSSAENIITKHPKYNGKGNPVTFYNYQLTTPVNYTVDKCPGIDSQPTHDPYSSHKVNWFYYYQPMGYDFWVLWSIGNDQDYQLDGSNVSGVIDDLLTTPVTKSMVSDIENALAPYQYDPTNGTFSPGDLFRTHEIYE